MDDILIDTGPLLAALNRSDQHHAFATRIMRQHNQAFITSAAVITETMYLAGDRLGWHAQEKLLEVINRGDLIVQHLNANDFLRVTELMRKYVDSPMDFADATLVALAERLNTRRVFTIDARDFHVYRWHDRQAFELICP